jgi:hypothetical protein
MTTLDREWYFTFSFQTRSCQFPIQSCHSYYARLYLCQRPIYKILVKVRNSKKNVFKIVLIIVNINKDENKSLTSNQFSHKKTTTLDRECGFTSRFQELTEFYTGNLKTSVNFRDLDLIKKKLQAVCHITFSVKYLDEKKRGGGWIYVISCVSI